MAILCPSSTAMHHLLFCSFVLFLSCCMSNTPVNGAEDASGDGFHSTPVSSLLPKDKCSAPAGGGSRGLRITPRYGPCSKQPGRSQPPGHQEILGLDEPRIGFATPKFNSHAPGNGNGHGHPGKFFEEKGNFLVEVGFGTPQQKSRLLLDTGSSLTWTQCKSCVKCLKGGASHFDPLQSASYSSGSCNIGIGEKNYSMIYADKSSSKGNYGCDKLTLEDSEVLPKFQFGCGRDNRGDFGQGVDGVLGLGRGPLSLLSQTASKYKKVFSYCLPAEDTTGSLLFGDHAKSQISPSFHFTTLVRHEDSENYFVNLLGISVGNKPLNISSSVFANPGTIIDSGTVVTRLPSKAYSSLTAEFREAMSSYTLLDPRRRPPGDILDTCYDLRGNEDVTLPDIVLHFDRGTNVVLNENRVLWGDDPSRLCLAFAESTDSRYTIFGNRQQLSLTVLYDLQGGRIGFGNGGCKY